MKKTLLIGFTTAIMGIITYPLFDFILNKFFTKEEFTYSIQQHLISPIIFGIILSIVLYFPLREPSNNKKSKK